MKITKWRSEMELSKFAALPGGRIFVTGGHGDARGLRVTFFNPDALDLSVWPDVGAGNGTIQYPYPRYPGEGVSDGL